MEVTGSVVLWLRQREQVLPGHGRAGDRGFNLHNIEAADGAQLQALCPGDTPPTRPPPLMSPPAASPVSCKCHAALGRASQIAHWKLGFGNVWHLPRPPLSADW